MTPITDSLTASGIDDIVIWNNAEREDLAVYGRYAAIAEAKHDLILVQDDDCVLPPESIGALVDEWTRIDKFRHVQGKKLAWVEYGDYIVANMPQPFRAHYSDSCLVGFGAVFQRDLPWRAFERLSIQEAGGFDDWFRRTCDVVFTALTPRVLVDVEYQNLPWAEDETRMYRQPEHVAERTRMLELVRKVRDA